MLGITKQFVVSDQCSSWHKDTTRPYFFNNLLNNLPDDIHTAEKRLKLAKKYARAYTASFCHQWGILKLLQAKISRSTENIGRLRGFKIVNSRSHYVLFKIEKSPFITSFYYCIWHWIKRKNIEKKDEKKFLAQPGFEPMTLEVNQTTDFWSSFASEWHNFNCLWSKIKSSMSLNIFGRFPFFWSL